MKILLVLLALLGCMVTTQAQERVSEWKGTVSTASWIANKKVLPSTDWSSMNISVYDSSGGPVQIAFLASDTTARDNDGYCNFATIPPGATFNFTYRATRTIFLKAVGSTANVTVTRY